MKKLTRRKALSYVIMTGLLIGLLFSVVAVAQDSLHTTIQLKFKGNPPKYVYFVSNFRPTLKKQVNGEKNVTVDLSYSTTMPPKSILGYNYAYGKIYYSSDADLLKKSFSGLLPDARFVFEPTIIVDENKAIIGVLNKDYQDFIQNTTPYEVQDVSRLPAGKTILDYAKSLTKAQLDAIVTIKNDRLASDLLILVTPKGLSEIQYEQIENRFSPEIKNSKKFKYIFDEFNKYKHQTDIISSILLQDKLGKSFLFEAKNHDFTVIDFWATWCGPCIQELPRVIAITDKYASKGLFTLYVSMDHDLPAWKKYIYDSILTNRHNYVLPGNFKSLFAASLNLRAIPATFIIDRSGKVIASNLHGEDLDKRLGELFGDRKTP